MIIKYKYNDKIYDEYSEITALFPNMSIPVVPNSEILLLLGIELVEVEDSVIVPESLDFIKLAKIKKAGERFVERRDRVRWVNGFGYDCSGEDIVNFLASYIAVLSSSEDTLYKVWIGPDRKGLVKLNINDLSLVYKVVRESQFQDYIWYEKKKFEINMCTTKEEVDNVFLYEIPVDNII